MLLTFPDLKESTISADKPGIFFSHPLYAYAYINFGSLHLCDPASISYDGHIENRKFQRRITRDRHKESEVRQELYRANQYKKPWQDARVFYCLSFLICKTSITRLKYRLQSIFWLWYVDSHYDRSI